MELPPCVRSAQFLQLCMPTDAGSPCSSCLFPVQVQVCSTADCPPVSQAEAAGTNCNPQPLSNTGLGMRMPAEPGRPTETPHHYACPTPEISTAPIHQARPAAVHTWTSQRCALRPVRPRPREPDVSVWAASFDINHMSWLLPQTSSTMSTESVVHQEHMHGDTWPAAAARRACCGVYLHTVVCVHQQPAVTGSYQLMGSTFGS